MDCQRALGGWSSVMEALFAVRKNWPNRMAPAALTEEAKRAYRLLRFGEGRKPAVALLTVEHGLGIVRA